MTERLLLVAVVASAYVGLALLALSQTRHWAAVAGSAPRGRARVVVLRTGGGAMIAVSLLLALYRDGMGFGSLLWATALSAAALAVALTLTWRPGFLRPLARARVLDR